MKIAVIGTGYVGLVTGTCFASLGNEVICVDCDKTKIDALTKGKITIYEPGLEEMVKQNSKEKRLSFTTNLKSAINKSEIIFIAVGTPPKANGEADLSYVENVARQIAEAMPGYRLIVEKSTVPVETCKWVEHTIKVYKKKSIKFDVASNPEFLREGSAIQDFLHPDRIVIGVETKRAEKILTELYKPLRSPIVVTDIKSAELIKHASNSFLATKISFINSVSAVCDEVGADIVKVAEGMGLDKRIGRSFLNAGCGYGGSCFPKDVDAFVQIAGKIGYDFELLRAVRNVNEEQRRRLVKKIENALWILKDKKIGILGLAFKPDTDDMRSAASIDIINMLKSEGARIKAYDPQAMKKARKEIKDITFCTDPYQTAKDSDCLLVLTEWNEFKELDFKKIKKTMKQPVLVDGRNIYEPIKMRELGFKYVGMGRN